MKPKLIYLEWADAITNAQWRTADEVQAWAKQSEWLIHMAGWLITETDEYIVVALGWKPEDASTVEQFVNLHKIPKTWIKKRKVLKP